jgi:hypothetical protein
MMLEKQRAASKEAAPNHETVSFLRLGLGKK